jgi:ATP:ADP antiporter, AAA family
LPGFFVLQTKVLNSSVNSNVLRFMGVKNEEQLQVVLMLGMGFFIGIFVATYQVTAESLFLNKLSGQLNRAFLISGVLGIASTAVFSYFQSRIRFIDLTIISMVLMVGGTFALYYYYHSDVAQTRNTTLFFMYCLIGPMTAILLLCYWGLFGRLFNFKQSKRIIGWIDTGQLLAIIAANFLIPFSAKLFPDTSNYLWVCNVSILGALVCVIIIALKFSLARVSTDPTVREGTRFGKIFKDRYVVLLSLFLVTSMVTFIFNQYTFQTLLNKQYPNQRDLTNFLAFFNGAIYALSLVMQLFINDRILSTYGIKTSLFILPAVVFLLAAGSIVTGSIFGFEGEAGSQTFIYFFLFVALTRLFNSMLKDSLENPIYKLLFIPLDSRFRFGIQAKVEGVVNESGRFLAGALIFLLVLIPFFNLLWVPVIVLGLLVIYYFVTDNLYVEYKNKIRAKLEDTGYNQEVLEVGYARIVSRLDDNILSPDSSTAVFSFKLLEKINPAHVPSRLNQMMKNSDERTREYAQKRMNELKGLTVSENYVIKINSQSAGEGKKLLSKSDLELLLNSGGEIQKSRIQQLARSTDPKDRHYAAELLLHSSAAENISFLIELLSDNDAQVRKVAISTATKKFNNEVIASLIENLNNPVFSNAAVNALIQIGPPALSLLDNAFYRTGQSSAVMVRLVQIIGAIGSAKAKDILWSKIDYPDKVIVSQVLLAMGKSGFKASLSQVSRIKYAIESDIADIAWNLAAMEEIGKEEITEEVKRALREEVQSDIEHIYMLLAMLYDTRSIQLVKENIESGTAEGVTYAIELLDVFLSEQLKQRVIPVLDDISNSEKVNRLELYYPRIKLDEKLVLKFIINRDFTQSNRWTKAAVLHLIGTKRLTEFTLDLVAQLFNPDPLISETAAWALYQVNPDEFHLHVKRLSSESRRRLDNAIARSDRSQAILLYDKVHFLKRIDIFTDIPGLQLSYLADMSKSRTVNTGQLLTPDEGTNGFYIVYQGELVNKGSSSFARDYSTGDLIGELLPDARQLNASVLQAREDTLLLEFNKDQFYELLSEQVKLAEKVLEYV